MEERVLQLAALSRQQDLYAPAVTEIVYDPADEALPEAEFNAVRIIQFIMSQPVYVTESNRFTGMLRLTKAPVPADVFSRKGHKWFAEVRSKYYAPNYHENLVIFEWQHAAPNYKFILEHGIEGSLAKIRKYKEVYKSDAQKLSFLKGVETVCLGLLDWSEHCADACEKAAEGCSQPMRQQELQKLAIVCRNVPRKPAKSFYEALQSLIFCFQFLPDSVGTIDRTLLPYYEKDTQSGAITREEAKHLIGEIFIHLSNHDPVGTVNADRTAQCHFAIGGYLENGEDGFNDLSRLMVETLMELDIRRPAMSLRWTKKTPYEVLRFMLDCERNDKNKRFAFVSDEPRIRALMNISGFSFEDAVKYTMVGCNEPSFPGAVWMGGCTGNAVRSLTRTLLEKTEEIAGSESFEDFYKVYREELKKDIYKLLEYQNMFNDIRARDINVLSAFLLDGCIENATAPNAFGCEKKIGGFNLMGVTCVIDSLTVIKQFVFDEKRISFPELIAALRCNWEGQEALRQEILKTARFFGNNDPLSNEMARRFTTELHTITKDIKLKHGANILIGTLAGYHPHHRRYGNMTEATPDGRYRGDGFMVGTGQCGGKDRKGITALMQSLAQMDPTGILCGPNVCNMLVEPSMVRNDGQFEKLCRMIETYFQLGGIHVQLNYVSKEELLAAKADPEKYAHLKVRVSGYSASFVTLSEPLQQDILERTVIGR
ncbi:MAG: hypothetical protein IKU07_06745 [Oscillospiraceae bacterium]|nr:hypothetical protein [Oscillospiraceae bacterium]